LFLARRKAAKQRLLSLVLRSELTRHRPTPPCRQLEHGYQFRDGIRRLTFGRGIRGSRWRYGASGTTVNIAARIRELARDGSILMSAETAARVSNDFVQEDLGEYSLKNVMKPVHIYRLISEQSD
jgi:class 3 adenylate cyclase